MPDLNSLTNDQQLALKTAAKNLGDEFAGTFGVETIEQLLATSYDHLARPTGRRLLARRGATGSRARRFGRSPGTAGAR